MQTRSGITGKKRLGDSMIANCSSCDLAVVGTPPGGQGETSRNAVLAESLDCRDSLPAGLKKTPGRSLADLVTGNDAVSVLALYWA